MQRAPSHPRRIRAALTVDEHGAFGAGTYGDPRPHLWRIADLDPSHHAWSELQCGCPPPSRRKRATSRLSASSERSCRAPISKRALCGIRSSETSGLTSPRLPDTANVVPTRHAAVPALAIAEDDRPCAVCSAAIRRCAPEGLRRRTGKCRGVDRRRRGLRPHQGLELRSGR